MSALGDAQKKFARLVGDLLVWVYRQPGLAVTFGEAYRTKEQAEWYAERGIGIKDSNHTKRLAIDLNLFKDGVYQTDSASYAALGRYWESLDPACRWGGRFRDGNHLEYVLGGWRASPLIAGGEHRESAEEPPAMAKVKLGPKAQAIVKTIAPTIGVLLGGPLGGLAGAILSSIFGTDDSNQIETAILASNPDALAKLKQAELEAQTEIKRLDIDLAKIEMEDRASARHLAEVRGFGPQVMISAVFMLGYFGALALFLLGEIGPPPGYENTIGVLVGVITTMMVAIGNFWFGSSSGSQAKTQLLSKEGRG
jgi:hypothetical protein